jgi:hypothetical protein
MRAGFGQFQVPSPEYLLFALQFGVTDILFNTVNIPSVGGKWALHDLVNLRSQVESQGMKSASMLCHRGSRKHRWLKGLSAMKSNGTMQKNKIRLGASEIQKKLPKP